MLEDHHAVGVEDGVETVRHDHHRALPRAPPGWSAGRDAPTRRRARSWPRRGSAARGGGRRPRERDALALSARQAVRRGRRRPCRSRAGISVTNSCACACRAAASISASLASRHPYAMLSRTRGVEEEGVLTDEADAAAPRGPVGAGQRDAVDAILPAGGGRRSRTAGAAAWSCPRPTRRPRGHSPARDRKRDVLHHAAGRRRDSRSRRAPHSRLPERWAGSPPRPAPTHRRRR